MSGPVVVVDSSIFIGAKNPDETEHLDCVRVLEMCHQRRFQGLISAISVAEVLTGYRLERDVPGGREFLDYVSSEGRIQFVPVGLEVCEVAADVRASTSLRMPDAIIVATAVERSASAILTHDTEFGRSRAVVPPITAKALIKQLESAK